MCRISALSEFIETNLISFNSDICQIVIEGVGINSMLIILFDWFIIFSICYFDVSQIIKNEVLW